MDSASLGIRPPFYENLEDNAHCLQASVKMAVEYFQNDFVKSFKFYDHITGKNPYFRYTWPLQLTRTLTQMGYDIVFMDALDIKKLAQNPYVAMLEAYGKMVADDQKEHSDLGNVKRDARVLLANTKVNIQLQIPSYEDITRLLGEGYLLICNVNAKALEQKEGYSGHFVLVYGAGDDPERLFVHNPGLPARREQEITRDRFEKAWAYPRDEYKNILALKKLRLPAPAEDIGEMPEMKVRGSVGPLPQPARVSAHAARGLHAAEAGSPPAPPRHERTTSSIRP